MNKETLAPYAMTALDGEKREHDEPEKNDGRTAYQRDIDRIKFAVYFRRLAGKAQVFTPDAGDNFRTRLPHSIDVASLTGALCRGLKVNEELGEAIGLVHDIGHPPFGHVGEEALDEKLRPFGLHFEHNAQGLRVVELLEKKYPGFRGLNLTKAVREGMMKHKTSYDNRGVEFEYAAHIEGQAANLADEIAYTAHDIEDGFDAGLLTLEDLDSQELWQKAKSEVLNTYGEIDDKKILVIRCVSALINLLIEDVLSTSREALKENNIQSVEDVRSCKVPLVRFSDSILQATADMRDFLMKHFYTRDEVRDALIEGKRIISDLFDAYYDDPTLMPQEFQDMITAGERKEIVVKDYIAGMTDRYARVKWEELNKITS